MKSNSICPFGPHLQKYWNKRFQLFTKFDQGIQVDAQALFSITPEEHALKHAVNLKDSVVVDAFGGTGGNTIAFAQYCKHVFMMEIDRNRLAMAMNNASVYGVSDKITFIHGDYFQELQSINADVLWLDPPWGGPEYSNLIEFKLDNFSPDGREILNLAFKYFSKVVMRIPKNFHQDELRSFQRNYRIEDDILNDKLISRTIYFMV